MVNDLNGCAYVRAQNAVKSLLRNLQTIHNCSSYRLDPMTLSQSIHGVYGHLTEEVAGFSSCGGPFIGAISVRGFASSRVYLVLLPDDSTYMPRMNYNLQASNWHLPHK